MKWVILLLLLSTAAHAKYTPYVRSYENHPSYGERLTLPHIYPGQTITTTDRFLEDPLRPGTSTVRWTSKAAYSINLDKVHLMRNDYTILVKSKYGPQLRALPFETTKIYLEPDYYKIRYDKETQTVWLARYAD